MLKVGTITDLAERYNALNHINNFAVKCSKWDLKNVRITIVTRQENSDQMSRSLL